MKTHVLVLLATTIAAAGVAGRASYRASHASAGAAVCESEVTDLRTKIDREERRLQALEAGAIELQKKIGVAEAARASANAVTATAQKSTSNRSLNPATIIANNPQYLAAYLKDFREGLDLEYAAMFHALGMSPTQIEEFKNLKVRTQQHDMDVIAVAETKGVDSRSPTPDALAALKAMQREEAAIVKQSEAAIFGPLLERYRQYIQTDPVRVLVRRLASAEAYPEVPLTAEQVERTTQILADNSRRTPAGTVVRLTVNWDNAVPQLQGIISAPQLAKIQQVHRQMELVQNSQQELNRALAPLKSTMPKS
jgi:hypothetical protein